MELALKHAVIEKSSFQSSFSSYEICENDVPIWQWVGQIANSILGIKAIWPNHLVLVRRSYSSRLILPYSQ